MLEVCMKKVDAWIESHKSNDIDPYNAIIHFQELHAKREAERWPKHDGGGVLLVSSTVEINRMELAMLGRLAIIGSISVVTRMLATGQIDEKDVVFGKKGKGEGDGSQGRDDS